MFRRFSVMFTAAVVITLMAAAAPLTAQSDPTVIADGLTNPRHLIYDTDGTLYIVEAGTGGEVEVEGPFGNPVGTGGTGQVLAVPPGGEPSPLIVNLSSMENGIRGPMAILPATDAFWLALGEGPLSSPFTMATVALSRDTLRVQTYVDIYAHEAAENPDGDVIASNPADLALADDGTLFIADAACNCVLTWTEMDGLQTFAAWSIDDNPVPTSLAFSPEGDVYVGFLTGFPFPSEAARIERWSRDGELVETFTGLTTVVDLLVDEAGTLYAVEMTSGFGDSGFIPESGRVVAVSADGLTPVAEGLNMPYGLAQAPDGTLVVAVNAAFSAPGSGQVIALPGS